ncbi:hypothetical protein E4U82_13915 [Lentibacillus salicampi]|uniref:Uncharacterized protein n=1 Tax=Lentibacillus salicampi TaxID=175306 RepID=A0A4Y9A8S2_9BACI|nr:hypothetical protein E4U82_13915 [Lentibacillus salicampi]
MTAKSHLRGHPIEYLNDEWVYCDTKETTVETHKERPCGYCGEHATKEGHDACLGTLPGVMNACCGHGRLNEAYVQLWDGFCIRGKDAVVFSDILKKWR